MSEHPCLGVALLCPAGDGVVKIVSKNCMIHLILSVNRYRLDIRALRGRNTKHTKHDHKLCVASWNVRTLLDNTNNPQRRTAVIGRELERYVIDIAAFSESENTW